MPSEAESAEKREALSNAESVEKHEAPVNVESAVKPAKLGMTEAAQTAAKQKTPSESQMAERLVKAEAVEKREVPSSAEKRVAPVVPQSPVRPAKSGMTQGLQAAVKPESFTEPEEYAPYGTEEPADYVAEESVDTREAEGNYQPFEEQERPPVRKLTREER